MQRIIKEQRHAVSSPDATILCAIFLRGVVFPRGFDTPSQQAASATIEGRHVASGTVKWYSSTRGFGFIQPDDGSRDVFVHINAVEVSGLDNLTAGQKVKFDTELGTRPGRINAVNIQAS